MSEVLASWTVVLFLFTFVIPVHSSTRLVGLTRSCCKKTVQGFPCLFDRLFVVFSMACHSNITGENKLQSAV
jgi:hypothetical protein